jgi:CRP-like cAMP-binding protein
VKLGREDRSLAGIPLFADLNAEEQAEVAKLCTWEECKPGALVFDAETDRLEVYFIVRGSVRILAHVPDGDPIPLSEMGAGNYFGELAAIDGLPRSARVEAAQPTLLASLKGADFLSVLERHPPLARKVMIRMARVIRSMDTRVANLTALSPDQRIAVELLRLAEPDPRAPNGWIITELPSHKELADRAGTTKEVVAQTIGELTQDGVVQRRDLAMAITNWSQLQVRARAPIPRDPR